MTIESEIVWLRILLQVHREQEVLQARPVDFDAWYCARTEQAHAAYMQRTLKHLVCDWRLTGTSSTKDIHQFFNTHLTRGAHATDC